MADFDEVRGALCRGRLQGVSKVVQHLGLCAVIYTVEFLNKGHLQDQPFCPL